MTSKNFPSTFLTTLSHTSRALTTAFDNHLRSSGTTAARGRVLLFLLRCPHQASQAEVTRFLRVEHPTAVRILDALEAQALIRRVPSEADRRAKEIVLTEQGTAVSLEIEAAGKAFTNRALAGFSEDEVDLGIALLGKLLANIEALPKGADDGEGEP